MKDYDATIEVSVHIPGVSRTLRAGVRVDWSLVEPLPRNREIDPHCGREEERIRSRRRAMVAEISARMADAMMKAIEQADTENGYEKHEICVMKGHEMSDGCGSLPYCSRCGDTNPDYVPPPRHLRRLPDRINSDYPSSSQLFTTKGPLEQNP